MPKTYDSVVDLMRDLSGEESAEKLEENLDKKTLATTLMALRCNADITQKQMAEKLGVAQSKISKLEHSEFDKINVGDLLAYAGALDFNLSVEFHKRNYAAEHVKYHAIEINNHLQELAKLAHKDDKINAKVTDFFVEAAVNLLDIIDSGFELLPTPKKQKRKKAGQIEVKGLRESQEELKGVLV